MPADEAHPVTNGPIVRVNPLVRPRKVDGRWQAPEGLTSENIKRLRNLPMDALKQQDMEEVETLIRQWLKNGALNQPIRYSRENSTAEIGHHRYSEAKAQAQTFGLCPTAPAAAMAA